MESSVPEQDELSTYEGSNEENYLFDEEDLDATVTADYEAID